MSYIEISFLHEDPALREELEALAAAGEAIYIPEADSFRVPFDVPFAGTEA